MSIPLIPTGEDENASNKAIAISVELKKGEVLPLSFMRADIIAR